MLTRTILHRRLFFLKIWNDDGYSGESDFNIKFRFNGNKEQLEDFLLQYKGDKYIDDCLLLLENKTPIERIFDYLNNLYDMISSIIPRVTCMSDNWNYQKLWAHYSDTEILTRLHWRPRPAIFLRRRIQAPQIDQPTERSKGCTDRDNSLSPPPSSDRVLSALPVSPGQCSCRNARFQCEQRSLTPPPTFV